MPTVSDAGGDAARLAANLAALEAQWGLRLAPTAAGDGLRDEPALVPNSVPTIAIRVADGAWRRVHSARAPLDEARRWLASVWPEGDPPALVCVIGAGLGWVIDAIEERLPSARVLVLEPEPACVPRLLARRDWRTNIQNGRLMVLAGPSFAGAERGWALAGDGAGEPLVLAHPVVTAARPDAAVEAARVVRRIVGDARANADAKRRFEGRYLVNTLRNLEYAVGAPDIAGLAGRFEGVPAIVCGAGPSLDRAIDALRGIDRLETRALLICADTALRPLVAAGLRPHVAVSLDPSVLNGRHFEDLPDCSGTWLVAEPSVDERAFAAFGGRVIGFRVGEQAPWPWLAAAGVERSTLDSWGSVITAACDLAMRMGCRPLLLAGLDLAYTGDRPYARGTTFERGWAQHAAWGGSLPEHWATVTGASHLHAVPDVRDMPVRTPSHLTLVRDWLVSRFARQRHNRIVNLTGAGILHGPGIEQTDPSALESLIGEPGAVARDPIGRLCAVGDRDTRPVRLPDVPEDWARLNVDGEATVGDLAARLADAYARGDRPARTVAAPCVSAPGLVAGLAAGTPERVAIVRALLGGERVPDWARDMDPMSIDPVRVGALAARLIAAPDPLAARLDLGYWTSARNAAQTPAVALFAWQAGRRAEVETMTAALGALTATQLARLGEMPSGRAAAEAHGSLLQPPLEPLDPARADASSRWLLAAEWLQAVAFVELCHRDASDARVPALARWVGAIVWRARCQALGTVLPTWPGAPPAVADVRLAVGEWESPAVRVEAPPPGSVEALLEGRPPSARASSSGVTLAFGGSLGLGGDESPRIIVSIGSGGDGPIPTRG